MGGEILRPNAKNPQSLAAIAGSFMEAPVGFEPTIRVLQTHALPLGYGAETPGILPNAGELYHRTVVHDTSLNHDRIWHEVKDRDTVT